MHQTNIFVTLHKDVDADVVSAIEQTLTPEEARRIVVTPAERAAREAQRILLSRQLQETSDLLQGFKRLLTDDMPSQSYLPKDLNDLRNWKAVIEKHLSTAALYGDVFNAEALLDLPRIRLDTVWYNFRDARYASANSLYNPGRFSTRFNPRPELGGGFGSLALAEDTSTATFELSRHLDLAETVQMLKRMALMQIRVRVNNVIDLTDPNTVASALGIDFGALTGMSFQDKVSVTQRICLTLVQSGCDGAVFPSTSTVGKKNLVLFADNIRSREPATVLSIKHLAAS